MKRLPDRMSSFPMRSFDLSSWTPPTHRALYRTFVNALQGFLAQQNV